MVFTSKLNVCCKLMMLVCSFAGGVFACEGQIWSDNTKTCEYHGDDPGSNPFTADGLRNDTLILKIYKEPGKVEIDLEELESHGIHLRELHLRHNQEVTFDFRCTECTLLALELQTNNILSLDLPSSLKSLISLKFWEYNLTPTLVIDQSIPLSSLVVANKNTTIPSALIKQFNTTLYGLILHASFQEFDHDLLLSMKLLTYFSLAVNQIANWPVLNSPQIKSTLTDLILRDNKFTVLNFTYISMFPSLVSLDMDQNSELSTVEGSSNQPLIHLDTIKLRQTLFTSSIYQSIFKEIPNIKEIYMNNQLTTLPTADEMKLIPSLGVLGFGDNKIAGSLDLNIFLSSIKAIELNSNKITWIIPPRTQDILKNLETLNLEGNLLTTVCDFCDKLTNMVALTVGNSNPLVCDKDAMWLQSCDKLTSKTSNYCLLSGQSTQITSLFSADVISQLCEVIDNTTFQDAGPSMTFTNDDTFQSEFPPCLMTSQPTITMCARQCLGTGCQSFDYWVHNQSCVMYADLRGTYDKMQIDAQKCSPVV